MADSSDAGGFLARWGRRKTQARAGELLADAPAVVAPVLPPTPEVASGEPSLSVQPAPVEAPPLPTMADVALLTHDSDYARFVVGGVDESVKRAAMKKLFSDPHFNVMDGLDIYIDDYSIADPIPLAMLREMNQSKVLKLFEEEDEVPAMTESGSSPALHEPAELTAAPSAAANAAELTERPDDDPDLRLQQDDDAGRPGPDQGTGR